MKCQEPFSLKDGVCRCEKGVKNQFNECQVCGYDNYFHNGDKCVKCDDKCKVCASPDGKCLECKSNFVLSAEGTCECPPDTYEGYNTCWKSDKKCRSGQYHDGMNQCQQCGRNCKRCAEFTGECLECNADYLKNMSNN